MSNSIKKILILLILMYSLGFSSDQIFTAETEKNLKINLNHALSLVDSIEINDQLIAFIHIFAEAPDYRPVSAVGEGIACVDDVGRFMEVLEYEILNRKSRKYIPLMRQMTRFLLYMSNSDGTWNNFIYSNGDRNVSHKNSEASCVLWIWIRTRWDEICS